MGIWYLLAVAAEWAHATCLLGILERGIQNLVNGRIDLFLCRIKLYTAAVAIHASLAVSEPRSSHQ
jgi:hypothetical protein